MIRYQQGWQHRILKRYGALAHTLHTTLTNNTFHVGNQPILKQDLHCLPSYKPFRWYRLWEHQLSFVSQERHVFLQIALAICLRSFQTSGDLAEGELYLADISFPAVGFFWRGAALVFCDRYPKQGLRTFLRALEKEHRRLEEKGLAPRWVRPFSLVFPKDRKFKQWSLLDAAGLEQILDPGLNDEIFQLDLKQLHRLAVDRETGS